MKKLLFILLSFVLVGCGRCPDGYEYEDGICAKVLQTTGKMEYEKYCIIGTLINDMCYPSGSTTPVKARLYGNTLAGPVYFCDVDYYIMGTMCYPKSNVPNQRTNYKCPYGYTTDYTGVDTGIPRLIIPRLDNTIDCFKRVTTEPNF